MSDDARFDAARNTIEIGASRVVFHCHHYNVSLQRTIDEALGDDAGPVQRAAAMESARALLAPLFARDGNRSVADRVAHAAQLFGSLGFGLADVSHLSADGGVVRLRTSHYALGWRAKFGTPRGAVCHFATGFWAGALASAAGLAPERVVATETQCAATRATSDGCEIQVEVR